MEEKRHGGAGRVIVVILILVVLLVVGAFFLFGGRVHIDPPTLSGGYRYDHAGDYHPLSELPAEGLTASHVTLNWIAGKIEIVGSEAQTVELSENFAGEADKQLRWRLDGDTLIVQPCASGVRDLPEKTLTVSLPCTAGLKIDTISADCVLTGLETSRLDFDSVSGALQGRAAVMESLCIDTVSGGTALELTASPETCDADTVSGVMDFTFHTLPGAVTLSSTSGNFQLILPEGCAYKLKWDTVSGTFDPSGYHAPAGKGAKSVKISADTVSGSLFLSTK